MHDEEINIVDNFCEVFNNHVKLEITIHRSYGMSMFLVGTRYTRKCLNAEKRIECFECHKNQ